MRGRVPILNWFLLRHYVFWICMPWGGLITMSFVIGIIERALSRSGDRGGIFVRVLVERLHDAPIYIEQTMPYGVLLGLMLGPWVLWRRGEMMALRFLGAGRRMLGVFVLAAFGFGAFESLVVIPSSLETRFDKQSLWRDDVNLMRKQSDGSRLILSAESYNTQTFELAQGVQAIVLDKDFRVQRYIDGNGGRITEGGWQIFEPRVRAPDGRILEQGGGQPYVFAVPSGLSQLQAKMQSPKQHLTIYDLPRALVDAAEQGQPMRRLIDRALFLFTLPIFYMGFAVLAYAIARRLPVRGSAPLAVLVVLILPFGAEVVKHLAWTQSAAGAAPSLLVALGLPSAFVLAALLVVRIKRAIV